MNVRSKLQEKPAIAIGIAVAAVVVAGVLIFFSLNASPITSQAYFTVDDGKTWFAESIEKIPPFEHDGKEAVKVYLYKCEGGSPFVTYLQRFTPAGKKQAEQLWAKAHANAKANGGRIELDQMAMQGVMMSMTEVKKPGETKWYQIMHAPASVMHIECPDGGKIDTLESYLP